MTFDDGDGEAPRSFVFGDIDARIEDPRRLERLRSTGLLTARHRPALDVVTHLAAELTQASRAMVSMVEVDRQVLTSTHVARGQTDEPDETPISHSFCQFVVMNDAPLIVGDARTHPLLSSHPAVLEGAVVAYVGVPVRAPDGEVLGALCVVDEVPRDWTPADLSGLKALAVTVDTKIALQLSRRELHLDHERLMHVLDGAAHTLIIIAEEDGAIRTMNHAAEVALGSVVGGAGARTVSDLVGAGLSWRPEAALEGLARDWVLGAPHEEQRIFSVRVSALHDPEGEIDGYIVMGDDVSARRKAEDLLRDTVRKQAEAVKRLEALDAQRSTFIATASHELRTPVTSILGYTELLADGDYGELTPPQRALVARLVRNGHRLQHLIGDLLSLDQLESDNAELVRTAVDVDHLVEQVWESLQGHLAGRGLTLTRVVPPDLPPVSGDPRQLERALVNLMTNAIKFTPDAGTVRLRVRTRSDGVEFEVSDTGVGISADDQLAVFEPFFRTHEAHVNAVQGSGIGLSVVRRIIESHGGRVELTSILGEGTRVRFTLPVLDADLLAARAKVA